MDELMENYLQGKMSKAEQQAFEEGLSPQEKEELASELGIRAGLESGFRKELRDKVAGFEEKRTRIRRINPAYISIAASIFIVASLVTYFINNDQSLFDQYYQPYPNYELTTIRGNDELTTRERAYRNYDQGDYEAAVAAFNELSLRIPADYFFRGICHIQLQHYELALSDLNEVSLGNSEYAHLAKWYAALVHLKLGETEKSSAILKELHSGNSEHAGDAEELLEKL
jgi:tetratricopeptide (TPR) repeat protein